MARTFGVEPWVDDVACAAVENPDPDPRGRRPSPA